MEIALSVATQLPEQLREEHTCAIAGAHNHADRRYKNCADGSAKGFFVFDGSHSLSDLQTWVAIEERLHRLRLSGCRNLRILDLKCSSGAWMHRVITRAHQMGFTDVTARGVDLSDCQIQRARESCWTLVGRGDNHLTFDAGDIRQAFPEEDRNVDLCLYLYGVMGWFVATVRAIGSTPTIYVEAVSESGNFWLDNLTDRLEVEFQDRLSASFNPLLFNQIEMGDLVRSYLKLEQLRGGYFP